MVVSLAIIVGLFGCGVDFELQAELNDNEAAPRFEVSPTSLVFEAPIGQQDEDEVIVTNEGNATLWITGEPTIDGFGFAFAGDWTIPIEPGEAHSLNVVFDAITTVQEGMMYIESSDPDRPQAIIDLFGVGLTPQLEVDPDPIEFGSRTIDCEWDEWVTLSNVGDMDLTITDVLVTGSGFELASDFEETVLEPDESIQHLFVFSPVISQSYVGELVVSSNDPSGVGFIELGGTGVSPALSEQYFHQGAQMLPAVDIVFTVDQSGSMGDDQSRLIDNAANFMSMLDATATDYQLMVITSDLGCHNGTIITSGTADPVGSFVSALDGPPGGFTEAGLSILIQALEESSPGGCNTGFRREGVPLSAILVSDEPEQSPSGWQAALEQVQELAPDVVISAIAGDYPYGCKTAEPGVGYYQAVQSTGGVFLSVCATDWTSHIEAISEVTTEVTADLFDTVQLASYPDPSTIEVRLDGEVVDGWTYDGDTNTIVFDETPPDDVGITVTFTLGCG